MKKLNGLNISNSGVLGKLNNYTVWCLFTVIVVGITILTAQFPTWANIPFNVLFPLFALVFVKMVFFEKLKLSTLVILRILIIFPFLSITNPSLSAFERRFYVVIVLVMLMVNILEATFTDGFRYKRWHNFVTGIALAVTVGLFFSHSFWSNSDPMYSANASSIAATICWIIAYTLWNWIFVTNEFSPQIAALHVGILLTPLIGITLFLNPGYWLVFRANSLTFGGTIQITCKKYLEDRLKCGKFDRFVAFTKKKTSQIILMVINLSLILISTILFFIQK